MAARWQLSRAGILNVYQYGDEVLRFAGGRLLLRGVNGSGKSTAMNMLLPFLLEADTRRIDAAGEQSGVLKSWMLAGRDDAQPIGYLWLEVERAGAYLCFGCGIKANRAADTVSTWWFVTGRRPGVDFGLVEDDRPLTLEGLRRTLEGDPVFRHDQRASYRSEIRNRLYGGADLDQHLRLLHIVRNPRVGDRIDLDLPQHLEDALPQLSEAALADAAQPLDELEEHRRNVTELGRTAATLESLLAVYADYARAELQRRAADAGERVAAFDAARRAALATAQQAAAAEKEAESTGARVGALEAAGRELAAQLDSWHAAPAYRAGRDLEDLRRLVATLAAAVARAEQALDERRSEHARARDALGRAAARTREDHGELSRLLDELGAEVVEAGLPVGAPAPPRLETAPLAAPVDDGDEGMPPERPLSSAVPDALGERLSAVEAAGLKRRGDIEEVHAALAGVAVAEERLSRVSDALAAARRAAADRADALARSRAAHAEARARWHEAAAAWLDAQATHRAAWALPLTAPSPSDGGVPLEEAVGALDALALESADHHGEVLALLRARVAEHVAELTVARAQLALLEETTLPPPPVLGWQQAGSAVCLAEVVDFRDDAAAAERAGIEAALEAASLLGAEVTAAGTLADAAGSLLLRPGPPVEAPLSALLRVSTDLGGRVEEALVERLLASISLDPADSVAGAVVTTAGAFRVGPLSGRHTKDTAEHIGVSARRAALERQRAAARAAVAAAEAVLVETEAAAAAREAALSEARRLRSEVPRADPVTRALAAFDAAASAAAAADEQVAEVAAQLGDAELTHAEAVDRARRRAAQLSLPPDAEGLRGVEAALGGVERARSEVRARLEVLRRALATWVDEAERFVAAATRLAAARAALEDLSSRHGPEAVRLATLEEAVGAEYEQIVAQVADGERRLEELGRALDTAREARIGATAAVATARAAASSSAEAAASAERACITALAILQAACAVPGLLEAAAVEPGALRPPVEESPAGVRRLVSLIRAHVPAPTRVDLGADAVRNSLRQRRDSLGAGWDAEDRQPDERLPMAVEVTGPEGRMPLAPAVALVRERLVELETLLTAEQDSALRNLLEGLVAREVAEKLQAGGELIERMNRRLDAITTTHGVGVSLRWRRREGLEAGVDTLVDLLAKPPDLRTSDQDEALRAALAGRLAEARRQEPDAPYRDLVGRVLDYRSWHEIAILLRRPGRPPERLGRRSALSEGEKKIVSYLPLFAAVAASCDALAERAPDALRFLLLDDAFAKVSEDNHPKLFSLLVELDLDFVATSERLWGTFSSVPELAIAEVVRDAQLGVIVLEHSHWVAASGLAPW